MRDKQTMLECIKTIALNDSHVLAVLMNGSRVNPHVTKDDFNDYDIVYVVDSLDPFIENDTFLNQFGDILIKQEPMKMDLESGIINQYGAVYNVLMVFKDYNRIDLTLVTKAHALETLYDDSLTKVLLDKYAILPDLKSPDESTYYIKRPTKIMFNHAVNEFCWCVQNVVKGLHRKELPYAINMYHLTLKKELEKMLNWWIGYHHDFKVNTGALNKWFKHYLPDDYYLTYSHLNMSDDYKNNFTVLKRAAHFFLKVSKEVAKALDFSVNPSEEKGMLNYLKAFDLTNQ